MHPNEFIQKCLVLWFNNRCIIRSHQYEAKRFILLEIDGVIIKPVFRADHLNGVATGFHSAHYFGVDQGFISSYENTAYAVFLQGELTRIFEFIVFSWGSQQCKYFSGFTGAELL